MTERVARPVHPAPDRWAEVTGDELTLATLMKIRAEFLLPELLGAVVEEAFGAAP